MMVAMSKPVSHQKEKGSRGNFGTQGQKHLRGVRVLSPIESAGLARGRFKVAVDSELRHPGNNDELLQFTTAAHGLLNGALVRCEERYPDRGHHSVLYLVVDEDAEIWRSRLLHLHGEHFGPGQGDPLAPVQLHVVDRATDEAIERLIEAGLLTRTTNASRHLFSADGLNCATAPLSEAEAERAAAYRNTAFRKFKMARVVLGAGLADDCRAPLLEGILALGRAFAIEQRLPEPALVHEALLPPVSPSWQSALPILREFSIDSTQACSPVLEALAGLVG